MKAITLALLMGMTLSVSALENKADYSTFAKLSAPLPEIHDTLPDGELKKTKHVSDSGILITRYETGAKLMVDSDTLATGAEKAKLMDYKDTSFGDDGRRRGLLGTLGAVSYNGLAGGANVVSGVLGAGVETVKSIGSFSAEQVQEHPLRTAVVLFLAGEVTDTWNIVDGIGSDVKDDDDSGSGNRSAVKDADGNAPSQLQVQGEENQVTVKTTAQPSIIQVGGSGNVITVEEFEPEEESSE